MHNPEQFIESNTERSWQACLSNMSYQGTLADAIIIQAVANCLNLSIHIAESNETFNPVTIVQPMNVTNGCTKIYIAHIGDIPYIAHIGSDIPKSKRRGQGQTLIEDKLIDKKEKRRAYQKECMKRKELMQNIEKRRTFIPCKDTTILKQLRRKRKKLSLKKNA